MTTSTWQDGSRPPFPDDATMPQPAVPGLDGQDVDTDEGASDAEEAPHRRRLRRGLTLLGASVSVLALLLGAAGWYLLDRYAGSVERVGNVFDAIPQDARPGPSTSTTGQPVTFLLVGSDSRAETPEGEVPGARSDAIMLARITGDGEHAQLISIPRDSWVDVPGHGMDKINASYAYGGPALLVQTVEQLTGVRVDHYVAIDFDGLIQMTDDLGGVSVTVAETTSNGPYTFPAGINRLDGDQARWYLGQRYGLAGGDFDRVKRQQQFLRSLFGQLVSANTFSDPAEIDGTLRAVTDAVAVSDSLGNDDMLGLAYSLRDVGTEDVQYYTVPVLGTGREGPASVVYLDAAGAGRMWELLRTDSLAENAAEFTDEALGRTPR